MSVEIYITPTIRYAINDTATITVDGKTVGDCLEHLIKLFPQLRKFFFDNDHRVLQDFNFFVNGEFISHQDMKTPVRHGDKIHIVDIIIGG
jgi:molybdopterin converting factor small subunit